jgi:microcystin-dependent protein
MGEQYLAEIRMFAGDVAPQGWAFCDGQLLPVSQNRALFSVIGTTYGGDGGKNFALPDLRGASPLATGAVFGLTPRVIGSTGGSASVTLVESELPQHNHTASAATGAGTTSSPAGAVWAVPRAGRAAEAAYDATPSTQLSPQALSDAGADQPHNNLPPYGVVAFLIALQGVPPLRN